MFETHKWNKQNYFNEILTPTLFAVIFLMKILKRNIVWVTANDWVNGCWLMTVTLLHDVKELYKNRVDKLLERNYDYITQWITEKFGRGRLRHLQGSPLLWLQRYFRI